MKKVEECKEEVAKLLQTGLQAGLITEDEYDTALKVTTWDELQPILDKAQGVEPVDLAEDEERLRLARAEHPLHRSDFTPSELKMLKELAPDEYRLLSPGCPLAKNQRGVPTIQDMELRTLLRH